MADAAEIPQVPASARPEDLPVVRPPRSFVRGLIDEARPKQWIKNLLVVAAPAAAGVLGERAAIIDTGIAFVAFCLAASGTYFLNDAFDVDADRLHAKKRFRPVAFGDVSIRTAQIVGVLLLLCGIAVGFLTGWKLPLVVTTYIVFTTSYSAWLKHVAVVDLGMVAAGFVLRLIAGAAAVDVPISVWFFIVGSFGSLFMVAGKRHAEFMELGSERAGHRATLSEYSAEYLGYVRSVASGVAMVGYCLWAFEKSASRSGIPWYELSIVPFVLAVLRYALVVEQGGGGAPEEVVLGDRMIQGMVVAWVIVFGIAIYRG